MQPCVHKAHRDQRGRPYNHRPRSLRMSPHVISHRLGQSSSLRIERSDFLVLLVWLGRHGWREQKDSCSKASGDKEQAKIEERGAVERRDVADPFEVDDEIGRQPGGEAAEDDDGVDARGEEAGRDLDAEIVDDGAVRGFVLGCAQLVVGGHVAEEEEGDARRGGVNGDAGGGCDGRDLVEADEEELVGDMGQED